MSYCFRGLLGTEMLYCGIGVAYFAEVGARLFEDVAVSLLRRCPEVRRTDACTERTPGAPGSLQVRTMDLPRIHVPYFPRSCYGVNCWWPAVVGAPRCRGRTLPSSKARDVHFGPSAHPLGKFGVHLLG